MVECECRDQYSGDKPEPNNLDGTHLLSIGTGTSPPLNVLQGSIRFGLGRQTVGIHIHTSGPSSDGDVIVLSHVKVLGRNGSDAIGFGITSKDLGRDPIGDILRRSVKTEFRVGREFNGTGNTLGEIPSLKLGVSGIIVGSVTIVTVG